VVGRLDVALIERLVRDELDGHGACAALEGSVGGQQIRHVAADLATDAVLTESTFIVRDAPAIIVLPPSSKYKNIVSLVVVCEGAPYM
jgi:hypothetical protein